MKINDIKRFERKIKPPSISVPTFSNYRQNPIGYVRDKLGKYLTPQQCEILESLDTPPYRTLVRSANSQGKTFVAAARARYFFDCYKPSITLCTAPTRVQVRDLLFKELRTISPSLSGFLPKDTRLESSPNHFVHGFTAATADGFQGRHDEHLGILFDEATGIDNAFWERGETMFDSHPGHWWLCTYNPNDPSSPAFMAEESGSWRLIVLNALEHVNVIAELRGEPPPIPSAVRLATVQRRISNECEEVDESKFDNVVGFIFDGKYYHPTSSAFEAAILGRWPISASDAIWSPLIFEQCYRRSFDVHPDWQVALGVDVARFGDDKTTIAARKGPVLLHLEALTHRNIPQIIERIKQVAYAVCGDNELCKKVPVYIDDTGGYGAGVVDLRGEYNFIGVNAASKSPIEMFPNMRSYLWFNTRQMADSGLISFNIDPYEAHELKLELCSPRFHIDKKNRRVAEIKTQVKKRIGRSPDRADAVNLCYLLEY